MPRFVVNKIEGILKDIVGKKKITILGITYKPNINDLRESPITEIINLLGELDYEIGVFDPHVKDYKFLETDLGLACEDSDLILLGVGHSEFRDLDFEKIGSIMRNRNIFDATNLLINNIKRKGFNYYLLGQ